VLLQDAGAAKQVYDATLKQTGSVGKATSAYRGYWDALEADLRKHHELTPAIQATIDKYRNIPPSKTTQINAPGLAAAMANAGEYAQNIRNIPSSHTTNIYTVYHTKGIAATGPLGRNFSRWGGVYEPAADGLLRQAQIYPPISPGRYMIAEPQTGGEAFIPKHGDWGRSMSILKAAGGWLNADVIPRGRGSDGASLVVNFNGPVGSRAQLENWLTESIDNLRRKGRI
jgi:hypothetical protein